MDRFAIRHATLADAPALLAMYTPAVTGTPINFEYEPPTLTEYEERMAGITERYPWIVCQHDDRVTGFSFAGPHRTRPGYQWSVEPGVYVHPEFRRRGIARALYTSLFELLCVQGMVRAFAGITLPNDASVALHLSLGFEPVGVYRAAGFKLGRWHDAAWYQRQIGGHLPDSPARPLVPAEVVETAAWRRAMTAGLSAIRP